MHESLLQEADAFRKSLYGKLVEGRESVTKELGAYFPFRKILLPSLKRT